MAAENGWIGVDFDGTLAMNEPGASLDVGAPVPAMLARVKAWLAEGREVRIVTARVGMCGLVNNKGVSDDAALAVAQRAIIQAWCIQHVGVALPVTASKDFMMAELWDDRAVQVIPNTGLRADRVHRRLMGCE